MADTYTIVEQIGMDAICAAVEVKPRMLRKARKSGKFPSGWYLVVREMCDARGIECPDDAFNFKTPTAPQVAAE